MSHKLFQQDRLETRQLPVDQQATLSFGRLLRDVREFNIPRGRRPRKRRLKSEFAFSRSLKSNYSLQHIYFVKCKRTLFEPNSYEPFSSSERERKGIFTSQSCNDCKEIYKKGECTCRVVVLAIQPIAFLTFSLSSPSWSLKVPIFKGFKGSVSRGYCCFMFILY